MLGQLTGGTKTKGSQGVSSRGRVILDQGVPDDSEDSEEATPDALRNLLARKLAEEFRLTDRQRQSVAEYCESYGEEYVACKAEIVRSAPRKNATGALLASLRIDWLSKQKAHRPWKGKKMFREMAEGK